MSTLLITPSVSIPLDEIDLSAIRAQGSGGQNVNKVSTAIHLRFDSQRSALPDEVKAALLNQRDTRISNEGVVTIKAQRTRSQEKNREDALERLAELIRKALHKPKPRRATKPSKSSQQKRMDEKTKHGSHKVMRRKPVDD